MLFRRFALREGSGGAGEHRGGFGVHYEVELLRGEARASFVMDHGRFGPQGVARRRATARRTWCASIAAARAIVPPHLSKDQDIAHRTPATACEVMTPGGGGYGDPFARDPALVAARRARGATTRARKPRRSGASC